MGVFDSWGSTFRTLDHINNGLSTVNNYLQLKNQGATTGEALVNSATNGIWGVARTEYASERYERTGNLSGHLVNTLAGFGSTESNVKGTLGLMFTEPGFLRSTFAYRGGCCHNNFFMGPMIAPPIAGPYTYGGPFVGPFRAPMCGTIPFGGFYC